MKTGIGLCVYRSTRKVGQSWSQWNVYVNVVGEAFDVDFEYTRLSYREASSYSVKVGIVFVVIRTLRCDFERRTDFDPTIV